MKDIGQKILLTFLSVLAAGSPTWIYLFARWLLSPEGFWQQLIVLGVGLYVLGGIQFFLLLGLAAWLFIVWSDR